MLTNFSKWMIYTASYIVLYPILIIKILFSAREEDVAFIEKMRLNFSESREIIFVLLGFIVISALVIFILRKVSPNSRCKALLKNNVTYEVASFLLPYIISIFTIDLNWYGWLINAVIYILFGIVMMYADIVHLCPIFYFWVLSCIRTLTIITFIQNSQRSNIIYCVLNKTMALKAKH